MPSFFILYKLNPAYTKLWDDLAGLFNYAQLYQKTTIYEQPGNAKVALEHFQERSVVMPNQGLLVNSISLKEVKASSAIENIFIHPTSFIKFILFQSKWLRKVETHS